MARVECLIGKILICVARVNEDGEDAIYFTTSDGKRYKMYHAQDCCEHVSIEDITGDLLDLVGEPILIAEEVTSKSEEDGEDELQESFTWTFYKFATRKGYVDIRWYGTSNGYYSEEVDLVEI